MLNSSNISGLPIITSNFSPQNNGSNPGAAGIQHSGSGSLEKNSNDSPKQGGNIQGKRVFIESTTGGIINLTKQNKSSNARGVLGASVAGTMPAGPSANPSNARTSLTFGQAGHSTLPAVSPTQAD